jgi:hypothetical protein
MIFTLIDYHKGKLNIEKSFITLDGLREWGYEKGYKSFIIDFEHMVIWVTTDNRFTQR